MKLDVLQYSSATTYHVERDLELAQSEASIPHHGVVSEMCFHAIKQRRDNAPLQLDANTVFFFPLYDVEQGGTKMCTKQLSRMSLTICGER